jgi:Lipocalin-like domain
MMYCHSKRTYLGVLVITMAVIPMLYLGLLAKGASALFPFNVEMTTQKFIGTWELVTSEFRTRDDKITYPLGEKAVGILMYDGGGRFAAQLMRPDRPKFASGDMRGSTPEEAKTAVDGYVAYFGTYQVDEKRGTVVHHVEASLFPNWLGQDQVRFFEFAADLLTLRTPPMLSGGQEITGVLVWKRWP